MVDRYHNVEEQALTQSNQTWSGDYKKPSGSGEKRKRPRESGDSESERAAGSASTAATEKRGCAEGMSWWTCLLLGVDQSMTKQQVVTKKE